MNAIYLLDNSVVDLYVPNYRHMAWGAKYKTEVTDEVEALLIPVDIDSDEEIQESYKFMYYKVGNKYYKAMFIRKEDV